MGLSPPFGMKNASQLKQMCGDPGKLSAPLLLGMKNNGQLKQM
jgi:hypothetical protein